MLESFTELGKFLDEIEETAESTARFLRTLNGARTRLRNALEKANLALKDAAKGGDRYFAQQRSSIQKESLSIVKGLLKFELLNSILTNHEFDEPVYKEVLDKAIRRDETYTFVKVGSGFQGTLKVRINLNKTAGRLQSWASGIKKYRKILEEEKEKKRRQAAKKKGKQRIRRIPYNPIKASKAWRRIFSQRAPTSGEFFDTISSRLELSGAEAPFWQIIDQGEPLAMSSNRGGFPTPTPQPTHFVKNTEKLANEYLDRQVIASRAKYIEEIQELRDIVDKETLRLEKLDGMAEAIRLDIKDVRKLERQLQVENVDRNRSKLENAVQLIRQGVLTTGRLLLKTGQGKTRSILVEKIRRYL